MHLPAVPGTVYLVGAGPGDPGLITVRGLGLLRRADVVVYDRLVHPALLDDVRGDAERIDAGKAPGRHRLSQDEINAVLVAAARRGAVVVRLKGGDPFVFGRGGEEALALAAAGVPFEVVPGVTSAVSVPASAGIPVTHRGIARSFTVVTGHACGDAEPDWDWLAGAETLVVLMGQERLPYLTARLLAAGRAPETPAAVVHAGTRPEQQVVFGTLHDIATRTATLASPSTLVVGEVVRLAPDLAPHLAAGVPAMEAVPAA